MRLVVGRCPGRRRPDAEARCRLGARTVHVGVARGRFQALLDGDLYLPKAWDQDRDRCEAPGIPDGVRYRAKWRIALDS